MSKLTKILIAQSHDFVTEIYSNIHHKMQSFLVFSYHLFCPTFNNLISMMMTLIFSKNMKNILFIKSNTQSWNYESWNFPKWVELIIQKNNKFSFRIGCFIRWKQILFIFCEKINVISQLFKYVVKSLAALSRSYQKTNFLKNFWIHSFRIGRLIWWRKYCSCFLRK